MMLSKSDYMMFLKHPAWLWLKKHDKNKLPPIDENTQAIFDTGHLFEEYAEQLFPESEKLGFGNYEEYKNLPLVTKNTMDKGVRTIFQGRFEYGELTCIIDVLDKVADGEYDLYEIKSSTSAKPEHIYDLAFQVFVLESLGLKINKTLVIHVNTEYKRDGEIKCEEIAKVADVTTEVRAKMTDTKKFIEGALTVAKSPTPPDFSPRFSNTFFRDWLEIYRFANQDLDKFSIYYLSGLTPKLIQELEDRGIKLISEIPDDLELTPKQRAQVNAVKQDKQFIDKAQIKKFLDEIKYPLYFLDYETASGVIPDFDGTSPYQQVPFQYSLHIIEKPGGELKHKEYLHRDITHPCMDLLKNLKKDLGKEGTVLVWYEPFEKGRNTEMGEMFPEYKEFLEDINNRVIDLMTPFKNDWFVDKGFFGSASIKNVLPVLAEDLSYKTLGIQEGGSAQRYWMETILRNKKNYDKDKVIADLIEYCKMDTLAMVRLYEVLVKSSE